MKNSNDKIFELNIIENNNKNIYTTNYKYVIPIYQRAYEWNEKQINELFDDLMMFHGDTFYLGIMVTYKRKNNEYEIVDGQQRLTTLFIILKILELPVNENLTFELRSKSSDTLRDIKKIVKEWSKSNKYFENKYDSSIIENAIIIDSLINQYSKEKIIDVLYKTKLIFTEVPEGTNLNHYFEIMNTRGEQLVNSDVIKSRLLGFINRDDETGTIERNIFSEIWEACSDMNSYIQMNFNPKIRKKIFGNDWDCFIVNDYDSLRSMLKAYGEFQPDYCTIDDIINNRAAYTKISSKLSDNTNDIVTKYDEADTRYESIITFSVFLLHVLKIFVRNNIKDEFNPNELLDELLDDKKLIENYDFVLKNFDKTTFSTKEDFSNEFIYTLLKCRFLFDNFIIKREFTNKIIDGRWSVKTQKKSSYDTPYPKMLSENITKLQALLRVSYTSPKVMHWITLLLEQLYMTSGNISNEKYELSIKNLINSNVKNIIKEFNKAGENYVITEKDEYFHQGVEIHHVIFNYLDYLLWEENKKKYNNFDFDFRNSVEHFYPQHPEGFPEWNDSYDLNYFGNLCLVSTSFNSKLSNDAPLAKVSTYSDQIKKGSIKLRIMADYINEKDDNQKWKDIYSERHGEEMIRLLLNNINSN